jgi:hypothetical protein
MRPEPLVRDYLFTRFLHHGLRRANAHARKRTGKSIDDGVSPSPQFEANRNAWDRTHGLDLFSRLSPDEEVLLVRASLAPDKLLSKHPALRVQHKARGG